MQIYYDAKRYFYNKTGLGNYSRWLCHNYHENYPQQELTLLKPGNYASAYSNLIPSSAQFKTKTYPNFLSWNRSVALENQTTENAVLHGLSNELPIQKIRKNLTRIVTIHDVIFKYRPQDYRPIDRLTYDLKTKFAIERADFIIAISETTKRDLIQTYHAPIDKIVVIYQNMQEEFSQGYTQQDKDDVRRKFILPDNFFVCVSSFNQRKNQQSILHAYSKIPTNQRMPILFIGTGATFESFQALSINMQLQKSIYFIPYVNTQELAIIYRMSSALIYPSLYEGFGLPAVEALHSGIPVIGHHHTSVQEAAGPGGIFMDTLNVEVFADTLQNMAVQDSLRTELVKKGKKHIQSFDSKNGMSQLHQLYTK
ncbi:MAG: glycosyltransferase family 4 protein [Bacteroidota bacterium]|nr:glycosyltransferase family 4 protein [Bacteroidota bacterium]